MSYYPDYLSEQPTNWPDLIEWEKASSAENLQVVVEDDVPRLADTESPLMLSAQFHPLGSMFSNSLVICGPRACLPAFAALAPFLPSVLKELERPLDYQRAKLSIGVLAYVNAALCSNAPLPPEAEGVEERWLKKFPKLVGELNQYQRRTLGFAALASGQTALLEQLLQTKPKKKQFRAGSTFGPDVESFIYFLAAAAERGAGFEEVEPAWREYVWTFPERLAESAATWPDLLWCARAVFVKFEGLPTKKVGQTLHTRIKRGDYLEWLPVEEA